ncbi:unnamed protein product [Lactuca virosa]|uniref:Pectinesterase inhibitor domain-containing protein n=1 Tax=Lactuca virosa TaxID=75947 RepID=A0AAU9PNX1_9ASTR|nr:unnamed protein product [Lactuca virosa]
MATTIAMMVVMSHATTPNSKFCEFARLKPLCNRLVHNATNYHQALKNAFRATLVLNKRNSIHLLPMVTSVIRNTNSPSRAKILKTCQQKVTDVASYLTDLIEAVDEDNKDAIEYYLRTGEITLRDCVESISEIDMTIPPALSKLAQDVEDYKETTLVIFLQAPIETVYNKPLPTDYSG